MHSTLIVLNDSVLLACCSMYFGTGWSLALFSIPPPKTVDNYYAQVVPQVALATWFLTRMACLMYVLAAIMTISEWHHKVWAPLIVLVALTAAITLTVRGIFPLNRVLGTHIRDPDVLDSVMRRWKALSNVRLALWTIQWLAMATYFGLAIG